MTADRLLQEETAEQREEQQPGRVPGRPFVAGEEQRAVARQGGLRSVEVRQERARLRGLLEQGLQAGVEWALSELERLTEKKRLSKADRREANFVADLLMKHCKSVLPFWLRLDGELVHRRGADLPAEIPADILDILRGKLEGTSAHELRELGEREEVGALGSGDDGNGEAEEP